MKKPGAEIAHLSPNAKGWRLHYGGAAQELPTLEEAAAAVPPRVRLHLAIPCDMALLERMTLPATSRDELAGMAQLQLEKTLPYPMEEASSEMEVISQDESESTVLSIAVHTESLSRLCEPLRSRQKLPRKITLYAQHIAEACPADQTVLAVWNEQDHLALAILENRKLSWAHTLPAADAETLTSELSGVLLGADLEGVPTNFSRVLLTDECAHFSGALREALGLPVEIIPTDKPLPESSANLLPPSWADESQRAERGERVRKRLMMAAVAYLILIACAFVYLAFLKHKVQQLDAQIVTLQPRLATTQAQQKRWQVMAPAIDRELFAVEIILAAQKSLPNDKVLITLLETSPSQFRIEGEAPNTDLAIEYTDRIRKDIPGFQFKAPTPPTIVDETHTKFNIFGTR